MIMLLNHNILFIIMSSKQDIINDTYFDRGGFGSKARTLQEARKKDKSITAEDVNEFLGRTWNRSESKQDRTPL